MIQSKLLTSPLPHLLVSLNSKPVIRQDVNVVKNTVINLSDEPLEDEETSLVSLGLKFCPASDNDSVAKTSSKLRADEDNDDVIESFSLYYIFSVFPSFVYYYIKSVW